MTSIFARGGRTAWAQYTKVLEDFVGPPAAAATRVQALSIAEIAPWDSAYPNYNRFLQGRLADRLGQWAAVGSFTGRSVSSGYHQFLSALQGELSRPLPAAERASLEASHRKVEQLRGDALALEKEIARRWSQHRRDMDAGRVPLSTRRAFEEQRGLSVLRDHLARRIATGQQEFVSAIHAIGGDIGVVGDALAGYFAAENGVALPDRADDDLPELADGWPILRTQGLDGDVSVLRNTTRRQAIVLAPGGAESQAFATAWDGCSGPSLPFWSIAGGADGEAHDERTGEETVSVTIAVENIVSFGVWRGPWYRPALLASYGALTPGAWQRDGYLNVVPTAFILARGITVTAVLPTSARTYAKHTFNAGGEIRVGPFTFGGGGGATAIRSACETTSTGLKIVDISSRALIVGMTVVCPPVASVSRPSGRRDTSRRK